MGQHIDVIATYIYSDNGHLDEQIKLHPGAIQSLTVRDMMNKILAKLGPSGSISSMRVFGHGAPGMQYVGAGFGGGSGAEHKPSAQMISAVKGVLQHTSILSMIQGRFDANAIVELHGCSVGKGVGGQQFARALAQYWNVVVRAGTDLQYSDSRDSYEGGYLEAFPNGAIRVYTNGVNGFVVIPPPPPPPPVNAGPAPVFHQVGDTVTKSDWLSSIALTYYKDALLWPVIHDANYAVIGSNPNIVKPRQKLLVPDFKTIPPASIPGLRQRGLNWRR